MDSLLIGFASGFYVAAATAFGVFWFMTPDPRFDTSRRRLLAEAVVCGVVWPIMLLLMVSVVMEDV